MVDRADGQRCRHCGQTFNGLRRDFCTSTTFRDWRELNNRLGERSGTNGGTASAVGRDSARGRIGSRLRRSKHLATLSPTCWAGRRTRRGTSCSWTVVKYECFCVGAQGGPDNRSNLDEGSLLAANPWPRASGTASAASAWRLRRAMNDKLVPSDLSFSLALRGTAIKAVVGFHSYEALVAVPRRVECLASLVDHYVVVGSAGTVPIAVDGERRQKLTHCCPLLELRAEHIRKWRGD